jgi:hypothetical protein
MVWCQTVIKQIRRREGFDVIIKRNNITVQRRHKLPGYGYKVALKNTKSVAGWRRTRFRKRYPGYSAVVLNAKGKPVIGGTHLGTVRDTYLV